MEKLYNWKRYWHPRDSEPELFGGFLADPRTGGWLNQHVKTLDQLEDAQCLALLGEQGAGKSVDCGQLAQDHRDDPPWFYVDTGQLQTETRLAEKLFRSREWQHWRQNNTKLRLILDGLDEGPLDIMVKARRLVDEFTACKDQLPRLRIRLVCRNTMWSAEVQAEFEKVWGQNIESYQLCPLTEQDLRVAATDETVDPDGFLDCIRQRDVEVLASIPLTLGMLLKQYRASNDLPATQRGLMEEGCLTLCEDRRRSGRLSRNQRMAIAGRLAVTTVFANRAGLWSGTHSLDHRDESYVPVHTFCDAGATLTDGELLLTESYVREVLQCTGLFRSRGGDLLGWTHQAFPEFLAASYAAQHLNVQQLEQLLLHPDGKLVSELSGVASWLAEMRPDLRETLARAGPEVFLMRNISNMGDGECASITSVLLEYYQQPGRHPSSGDYRCLTYPGLGRQLQPYIANPDAPEGARYLAVAMAEKCRVGELQKDLLKLALDASEPYYLRIRATDAVSVIGDYDAKAALRSLLALDSSHDPDDELRGYALRAQWPGIISTADMFSMLTEPSNPYMFGSYQYFCSFEVPSKLSPSDLPSALEWAAGRPASWHSHRFDELLDRIISLAWENLTIPQVLQGLARGLVARLGHHEEVFIPTDREDDRHLVASQAFEFVAEMDGDVWSKVYALHRLVTDSDLKWLISQLHQEKSTNVQEVIAGLVRQIADFHNPEQLELVLAGCAGNEILKKIMNPVLAPVELESEKAKQLRKQSHEEQRRREAQTRRTSRMSPSKRIQDCVAEAEAGRLEAWWHIDRLLCLDEDGQDRRGGFSADLTLLPGWSQADETTRTALIAIAKRYVQEWDPETPTWLGKSVIHYPAHAGFRALHLLLKLEADFVESLDPLIWERWAPAIIQGYDWDATDLGLSLAEMAYSRCPGTVLGTLDALLGSSGYSLLDICERLWDSSIASLVVGRVKNNKLAQHLLPEALRLLLVNDHGEDQEYVESMLALNDAEDEAERNKAIEAALALIKYTEAASWPLIKPLLADAEFGPQLVVAYAHTERRPDDKKERLLTPDQMADVFIHMQRFFPEEDGHSLGTGPVAPADERYFWKVGTINYLKQRGETSALERIRDESSSSKWVEFALIEADNVARADSWVAPEPEDVLSLLDKPRVRLVQTEDDLLAVVEESLARLQQELHGENPAVDSLWNEWDGRFKPKSETSLSNEVKRHLDRDLRLSGIISNREVEIRSPEAERKGQDTDILVQAMTPSRHGRDANVVSVIVETKGCWNRGLRTDMKTQLVDRYLNENPCQHGVYLVGWYKCPVWEESGDYRYQDTPPCEMADIRQELEKQAAELSNDIKVRALVLDVTIH